MLYYILQWDSFYIEQKLFLLQAFSDHYEKLTAPPAHAALPLVYMMVTRHIFWIKKESTFPLKKK